MREIKFRAWDGLNDLMSNPFGLAHIMTFPVGPVGEGTIMASILNILGATRTTAEGIILPRYEIMQYTGLKDKNGVEIYEGDIVIWVDLKCTVVWVDSEARFACVNGDGQGAWAHRFIEDVEVIGHIHEEKTDD